VLGQWWR